MNMRVVSLCRLRHSILCTMYSLVHLTLYEAFVTENRFLEDLEIIFVTKFYTILEEHFVESRQCPLYLGM